MLLEIGEKLHIIYRAIYENSTRRHFVGQALAVKDELCRLEGYAYVYDSKEDTFVRKSEKRVTFIDLGDSGYIVNLMPRNTDIEKINYKYVSGVGQVATDDGVFKLDISEFTSKT